MRPPGNALHKRLNLGVVFGSQRPSQHRHSWSRLKANSPDFVAPERAIFSHLLTTICRKIYLQLWNLGAGRDLRLQPRLSASRARNTKMGCQITPGSAAPSPVNKSCRISSTSRVEGLCSSVSQPERIHPVYPDRVGLQLQLGRCIEAKDPGRHVPSAVFRFSISKDVAGGSVAVWQCIRHNCLFRPMMPRKVEAVELWLARAKPVRSFDAFQLALSRIFVETRREQIARAVAIVDCP